MKAVNRGGRIFALGLLLFVLAMTFGSLAYDWQGRIVPLLVGATASGLGTIVLIREASPKFLAGLDRGMIGSTADLKKAERRPAPRSIKLDEDGEVTAEKGAFLIVTGWLVAYAVVVFVVGFYIGSALFAIGYIKTKSRTSWLKAAIFAAAICAGLYFFFEWMMRLALFRGLFFDSYIPPL